MEELILRGHLVIYVDGYKYHYKGLTHFVEQDKKLFAVPDTLMPPPDHEVDSMQWWEEGWAIGDNPTNRPCSRFGIKRLKKFKNWDDAVSFVYARQRKYKKQKHTLVYVVKNAFNKEIGHVVRSTDEIAAIDAEINKEAKEIAVAQQKQIDERNARYPELDLLRQNFGSMKAWTMAEFLHEYRTKGRDHIAATVSRATMYRYIRELKVLGIEIPRAPLQEPAKHRSELE